MAKRGSLAVLCAASFLAVVDTTIVSIAIPSIRRSLGFTAGGAQWVLSVYALLFGGLLLLFGRLADRVGRRRAFLAGLAVFALGCLVAGIAPSAWVLLAARAVQGVGAAAFVPGSLSLLTAAYPSARERGRALGAYGAMAGLGFVAGMVGGGVITQLLGWRWVFLLLVPVVGATLAAGWRVLPAPAPSAVRREPLDVPGALSVTAGLVLVIYAVTGAPAYGWLGAATWVPGLAGLALLAVFVAIERRARAPLIPPHLVARPGVLAVNGAITLESMVGVAWLYLLTLWFQDVRGADALETGLLFAPMTAASLAGASVAGRAAVAFGARPVAAAGMVLVLAGLGAMAWGVSVDALGAVLAGSVAGEAGFMLASVALTIVATGVLSTSDAGLAAGLFNTATQLGGGTGLGIVAAVAAASGDLSASALRAGFLACALFSALALVTVAVALRPATRPAGLRRPR